jgi:alpha-L-fucosidase 2
MTPELPKRRAQRKLTGFLNDMFMKQTIALSFILLVAMFANCTFGQDRQLKLWYDKPAEKWTEALPVGNGRIGAMIFGGVENERIQFNEETLWTGEPRSYSRPGAYKYLDSIRQLLFAGRQKEAEALAEREFMGLKSDSGKRDQWVSNVLSLRNMTGNPALADYDDTQWKQMQVPSFDGWEAAGFEGLDGAVWLRTRFILPKEWQGKELVLDLNRIRDRDLTYVNGQLVGGRDDAEPRQYRIPRDVLKTGINVIAVQVLNYADKGGISGYKDTSRHIGVYPMDEIESKMSLNGLWKYFIQDDNPPAVGTYQASYQPFGDITLHSPVEGPVVNYKRTLDISTAISTTTYTVKHVTYRREYFVSQPAQVMVIRLTASEKAKVAFEVALSSPHKNFTTKKIDGHTLGLFVQVRNGALHGESRLMIRLIGGQLTMADGRAIVRNADEAELYLAAGTNYRNYHDVSNDPSVPCATALATVVKQQYAQLRAAHIREYQQYFKTFSIDLGSSVNEQLPTDKRLEQFAKSSDPSFVSLYVQYGRYLLISSSRPGTRPANLQGVWNELLTPPWGSKYTTNINLEMNYWPSEVLNMSAMNEPLFKMIGELATAGAKTAEDHYHAPGWVLHHNTDLWRGTAPINASNHGIWVTGGAWLCQHLWEHYLFTQDENFLRKEAYPVMKSAAVFFDSFLIKDPATGYLISSPSNSPEQGGLVAGPTMDHQIIRNLFNSVITASTILETDAGFRDELKQKIQQIAPNKIGRYGQLQEWMKDVDDTTNKHRHISHLWGMYPGHEINWDDTPELMKAARQSLLYRGDAATGWSLGWKINCWARFKEGNHSFHLIQMLISPAKGGAGSYPNLFDAHPPFQIDGNFGGAAGIAELLVQSHTQYVDILPALPDALPYGHVKGICARGGFVLDIEWNNGKLINLLVLSKAGSPVHLRYEGKVISISTKKGGVYRFNGSLEQQ